MKSERMKKVFAWLADAMKFIIIGGLIILICVVFVYALQIENAKQVKIKEEIRRKVAQKYNAVIKQDAVNVGHAHYEVDDKGVVSFIWNATQPVNVEAYDSDCRGKTILIKASEELYKNILKNTKIVKCAEFDCGYSFGMLT